MKKIIFILIAFFSLSINAQEFEKNWEKVYTYELAGKIKSASDEVNKIYAKAKRKGNQPEIIKTFFYQSKFSQNIEEDARYKIIENLKKEIQTSDLTSKAIFYNLNATLLYEYYKANRYNLSHKTETDFIYNPDFRTWTSKNFKDEILKLFQKSLESEEILLNTPLNKYETIIHFNKHEKNFDLSLYDFLANRYLENIDYFIEETKQNVDTKNHINALYGETIIFQKLNFSGFPKNIFYEKLTFYQKLEKNYASKNNNLALSHTILKRLKTVSEIDKEYSRYLVALENAQNNSNKDYKNAYLLEIANTYREKASKEKNPDYNKKAIEIYDFVVQSNKTAYSSEASRLKNKILYKFIYIETENAVLPNTKNRALVNYKNFDTLYGSLYKIPNKLVSQQYDYSLKRINTDSLFLDYINKNKPYKTFIQNLPIKNDYFEYSTEIIYPDLEIGNYLLVLNAQKSVRPDSSYAIAVIKSTELKLSTSVSNGKEEIQIFNSRTGKPIENVTVKYPNGEISKTDSEGKSTRILNESKHQNIEILYKNDTITNTYYAYSDQKTISANAIPIRHKVNLFTDRSIYRPGQKVYFKGIASEDHNKKYRVIPDYDIEIIVKNASHEIIFKTDLKTNEFGSVTGELVLPKSGPIGKFRIIAIKSNPVKKNDDEPTTIFLNSESDFKVEEYKRPKFEILFEPTKENYLVNQKIKLKGHAKALAGSFISNAKVSYSIERTSRYKSNYYGGEYTPTKIGNGKVLTDQNGDFEIEFIALPSDLSENLLPVFNYTLNISVTDSNGETISAHSEVNVGYHNLDLSASIPMDFNAKTAQQISINSTNLNYQFTPIEAEIKIYKLKSPDRILKNRLWESPEIQTISQKDFELLFPHEPFSDENILSNWKKGNLVFTKVINTKNQKNVKLEEAKNWKSGKYLLIVTSNDISGKKIETSSFFDIHQDNDTKLADNQIFNSEIKNSSPKKDGFIELQYTSATEKLYIATEAFLNGKTIYSKIIEVNGKQNFKIPFYKNRNGRLDIKSTFVWQGEVFYENKKIELIEENKDLTFEIIHLKNKIEPGSTNNWSFKLKNSKNKTTETEALATMYDASLDAFLNSNWDSSLAFDNSYNPLKYKSFPENRSQHLYFRKNDFYDSNHFELDNETELNWFGFNFIYPDNDSYEYNKFLIRNFLNSKNNLIIGNIKRNGEPQEGVTVSVENTSKKTKTDANGSFEIKAKIGDNLAIVFEDNLKKTIVIKQKVLNLNLNETDELENYFYDEEYGEVILDGTQSEIKVDAEIIEENPEKVYTLAFSNVAIKKGYDYNYYRGNVSANYSVTDTLSNGVEINREFLDFQKKAAEELSKIQTRKNFNETAFFYPQIKTDKDGKFSFNFTSPEALTKWKLRILAHDKKAHSGYFENSIITQKDFMITPNFPRFLREKDSITITTKISNLTAEAKSGMALLQLFDAVTMEPIDKKMLNSESTKSFQIKEKGNTSVFWKIYVPEGLQGVHYKIVAKAGNFSDGEENILPVLTNSMLVTESIPVWVRENSTKEYTFENLKNNTSSTLRNQQLTFEYTSNPTWLAIQALPYLMEYEHECAEQTFARYYANALASEILNSNPKIADVFESWKKSDKPVSKLQQNEELKSVLLAETPWLADALSEEEKKKNLAVLFDLQKMKESQKTILEKLKQKQKASGGFAWFDGGEESEYVTRHIISGLGHLQHLSKNTTGDFDEITKKGIDYLDQKFLESHKEREKSNKGEKKLAWMNIHPYNDLHYLYARSFYAEKYPLNSVTLEIIKKYTAIIKENKLHYSLYEKGMASLVLSRFGDKETAKKILENLRQTSSNNNDWGMYWIENKAGWYWYQAPIETQALLIEAFSEIENDKKSVDAMKVWLLKNKQNKNWPTTKATTEAVYALLMQGNDWISVKDKTTIKLGNEKILTQKLSEAEKEAGTGYIKLNWKADEIKKEMATISINNQSDVPGFGGFYWQYFEDLDKIKSGQESPMMIEKELYLKANTSAGEQLQRITNEKPLKIGDLVTVRLVISTKEDMEFVHLKDMRASCFEPIDVLSKYKWQDGLGYYQSTKDVATHFFFDRINKGKFVLEYDIRVNNLGDFSNGISTIQSMYAPEFSSHTKGIRVKIKE